MLTLEETQKNWEQSAHPGSPQERIARSRQWLPYYAYLAAQQRITDFSLPDQPDIFVAELMKSGCIQPGNTLLDIGAGMGHFALEFARQGCYVTAMDPSAECLQVLVARAKACGLSDRIVPLLGTWEESHFSSSFDVTFSAMCPAICNMTELERMESITRHTCCLLTVTQGSYDRHRKNMMAQLHIQPQGGMVTPMHHYQNVLSLSGRQFHNFCHCQHTKRQIKAKTVLQQYPLYFQIFGIAESISVPFLQNYLEEYGTNGILIEESHLNQSMVWWHPKT